MAGPGDAPRSPRRHALLALAGWLLLCFVAASLGGLASVNAQQFYGGLVKPSWAPPPWLFGPVWSVLYTMMAFAAWIAGRAAPGPARTRALRLFLAQLAINALWSWLFFAWHLGGWALAEVLLLWASILATLLAFWRLDRIAGWLLVPYLAWVSFASLLNAVLWWHNPTLLG